MKSLFPSTRMLFFSRGSLYLFSFVILLFALSCFMVHISVITDLVIKSVDVHVKFNHARSELVRLTVSCMIYGMLLLMRAPFNKKDHDFNTTCHWYGAAFLYSAIFFIGLYLLVESEPAVFPIFGEHLYYRVFFWPVVNVLYLVLTVSFVYRSLQD